MNNIVMRILILVFFIIEILSGYQNIYSYNNPYIKTNQDKWLQLNPGQDESQDKTDTDEVSSNETDDSKSDSETDNSEEQSSGKIKVRLVHAVPDYPWSIDLVTVKSDGTKEVLIKNIQYGKVSLYYEYNLPDSTSSIDFSLFKSSSSSFFINSLSTNIPVNQANTFKLHSNKNYTILIYGFYYIDPKGESSIRISTIEDDLSLNEENESFKIRLVNLNISQQHLDFNEIHKISYDVKEEKKMKRAAFNNSYITKVVQKPSSKLNDAYLRIDNQIILGPTKQYSVSPYKTLNLKKINNLNDITVTDYYSSLVLKLTPFSNRLTTQINKIASGKLYTVFLFGYGEVQKYFCFITDDTINYVVTENDKSKSSSDKSDETKQTDDINEEKSSEENKDEET